MYFGYTLKNVLLAKRCESLFDFVNLVIRFAFGDTLAVAEKR